MLNSLFKAPSIYMLFDNMPHVIIQMPDNKWMATELLEGRHYNGPYDTEDDVLTKIQGNGYRIANNDRCIRIGDHQINS